MDYPEFYEEMNTYYYRGQCYHTMRKPDNDATSGNHHTINATYHVIAKKLGGWPKLNGFIKSTEVEPGLYNRHPDKQDNPQTHDDYLGMVVSSYVTTDGINPHSEAYPARPIYDYGKKHWWYYDNLKKPVDFTTKWNYWHGRFPGMIGVYKRAAGEKVGILDRAAFCVGIFGEIFFNKDKTDTSGRILQWLANQVMQGESKMVDYCIDKWNKNIEVLYPEGKIGEMLGYF